jgi:hypothetical protein
MVQNRRIITCVSLLVDYLFVYFKKKTKVDTVMDGKTLFLHINPSLAAYQMI